VLSPFTQFTPHILNGLATKEMKLQWHYSDNSRAEKAKEESFLSGIVSQGFTFEYHNDVYRSKIANFSVGKPNCLAAHTFAVVGRHEPPVDNMRMEAAIRKYGGKIESMDDLPSKSFPESLIFLEGKDVPEHIASKLMLMADQSPGPEIGKMSKDAFIQMIFIIKSHDDRPGQDIERPKSCRRRHDPRLALNHRLFVLQRPAYILQRRIYIISNRPPLGAAPQISQAKPLDRYE
jgi:hypothetical protein